jgi:hypothetical protein
MLPSSPTEQPYYQQQPAKAPVNATFASSNQPPPPNSPPQVHYYYAQQPPVVVAGQPSRCPSDHDSGCLKCLMAALLCCCCLNYCC